MQEENGVRNAREYYNSPSAEGFYRAAGSSVGLVERGLENWVNAGRAGALNWGIFRFQKGA